MARAGVLGFPGLRGFAAGGGGGLPAVPLVFDSGYALDGVTFSNSDLTATTATAGGYEGAYSDPLPNTGKFYIEFSYGNDGGAGGFGFTQLTILVATHPTEQVLTFVGFRANGTTGAAGTGFSATTATAVYSGADAVIGIAIDMDTGNFWHRVNSSSWSGGDPVAGTGACGTVPSGASNVKLFFTTNALLAMTIKAEADYTYATPSGFAPLGGA